MKFNLLYSHTNQELLIWYDTITKQNNFTNKNNIIIQNDGLAMGAQFMASYQRLSYKTQKLHTSHNKQNNLWS